MPSVSLAKLSSRMLFSTKNETLKLKKIPAHGADSNLRYARKQIKGKKQRKFGAVLRVPRFFFLFFLSYLTKML